MRRMIFVTIFVVLLPAVLFLLTGCLKLPEPSQDFGPSATGDELNSALGKLEGASSSQIRKGDFIYVETSIRLESLMPQVVRQESLTVVDRVEAAESVKLNILKRLVEIISGENKTSVTEYEVVLKKAAVPTPADSVLAQVSPFQKLDGFPAFVRSGVRTLASSKRVTFHNLKVEPLKVAVPLLVQMEENCGGLGAQVCAQGLQSVRVSVDQVIWENNSPSKTSFMWLSSVDVPPLAAQLSSCAQALMPFQGTMVNVLQCDDVKKFIRGNQ